MAGGEDWKAIERGMAAAIREGGVAVPALLLRYYRHLNLSDTEAMLLIHLLLFKEKEGKEFPTMEEIQGRMSATPDAVIKTIQRLVKDGVLLIDEHREPDTGVMYESYNMAPLYRKLASAWIETARQDAAQAKPAGGNGAGFGKIAAAGAGIGSGGGAGASAADLFTAFENEFARPLTPMECETITQWLDRDHHAEELILLALKEAVFAGVINFRYIDRILLEWCRNRVQTPEQAREYAQKFRGKNG